MKRCLLLTIPIVLAGCQPADRSSADLAEPGKAADEASAGVAGPDEAVDETTVASRRFDELLAARPDWVKARYPYRHPKETLEFIGIEPGMTVVEGLPGKGWYTRVLRAYLGPDGHYIGANYSMDMWPLFPIADEKFLAEMARWEEDWPVMAADFGGEERSALSGFSFGSMPAELKGTADVVFFPRVLHYLVRYRDKGDVDHLDVALADVHAILKPGGIFGVVQHHARDEMPDEWADGSAGYLKKQFVIDAIEAAGFEFIGESDINANPLDQPTTEDISLRLPPNLETSRDDPELRARYEAIGETNRMTLKFRKVG